MSGAPRPIGWPLPAAGCSAQRLTVRDGGVPRGAGSGAGEADPGAETIGTEPPWAAEPAGVAPGRGADAADEAAPEDRWTAAAIGASVVAWVRGRAAGVTVAAAVTAGTAGWARRPPARDQASPTGSAVDVR